MSLLMIVCLLFAFGSFGGWILELFYRRIFSSHKWINPGFLVGPCLPLYGWGITILFVLSYVLKFDEWLGISSVLNDVLIIVIMSIMMTVIEYIAGIIFIKGMGIKLWDYSNRPGNIQGIICPLFSLFWAIAAGIFYFVIRPICADLIDWYSLNAHQNIWLPFLLGMFYGVLAVDLGYSFKITSKIREFAKENKFVVKYEQFKQYIREQEEKAKAKISYVFPLKSNISIKENLSKYMEHIKSRFNNKDDKEK